MKESIKRKELLHNYYNCLDDLQTIGSNNVRAWLDESDEFEPDTITHYCRKCECNSTFYSYASKNVDQSTYVMCDVINDLPIIMMRKIYKCSCGREYVTVTQFFEQVGADVSYGYHPIMYVNKNEIDKGEN